MPAKTLDELCDAIREDGEYEGSATYTNAFLTRWVNQAIRELVDLVGDAFEGHFTKLTTVSTTSNVQTVSLPADLKHLRALDYQTDATHHTPLRRIALGETYSYQGTGRPRAYLLHGGSEPGVARLFPVPDASYTLRVVYEPTITALELDDDSFDFRDGWEDYVHQLVLLQIDLREEKPVQERLMRIERARQRIVGSASKRNSAEPEHLVDWSRTAIAGEEFLP